MNFVLNRGPLKKKEQQARNEIREQREYNISLLEEKIYIDRNQSNIMALGNASVSNTLANAYSQPTSLTAEARMDQLLNDSAINCFISSKEYLPDLHFGSRMLT